MAENRFTSQRPAHEVRAGLVRAAIWANSTKRGTMYNVTVSRLYKSGDDWKSSGSFGVRDLADLTRVGVLAEAWVREHQPKDTEREAAA
jgi:hypothetical protein